MEILANSISEPIWKIAHAFWYQEDQESMQELDTLKEELMIAEMSQIL